MTSHVDEYSPSRLLVDPGIGTSCNRTEKVQLCALPACVHVPNPGSPPIDRFRHGRDAHSGYQDLKRNNAPPSHLITMGAGAGLRSERLLCATDCGRRVDTTTRLGYARTGVPTLVPFAPRRYCVTGDRLETRPTVACDPFSLLLFLFSCFLDTRRIFSLVPVLSTVATDLLLHADDSNDCGVGTTSTASTQCIYAIKVATANCRMTGPSDVSRRFVSCLHPI